VLLNPCRGNVGLLAHNTLDLPAVADAHLGDVDADGILDIVAVQAAPVGMLVVLRGLGDGTFEEAQRAPLEGDPRAFTFTDLDADGRTELLVALHSGGLSLLGSP
jgi:hypothetical protein